MADGIKGLGIECNKMYRDLSAEEIKKLARDIATNKVFTSHHVPGDQPGELVFLPLLFLSDADLELLKREPPGMIYEYMDKRAPRLVNNLPCFRTCKFLSVEIADKVQDEIKAFLAHLGQMHLEQKKEKARPKLVTP